MASEQKHREPQSPANTKGAYAGPRGDLRGWYAPDLSTEREAEKVNISVVVPAYNDADTIRHVYDRLSAVLKEMPKSWEIVFVNDGSSDATAERLAEIRRLNADHVVVVDLMRNFGQHPAVSAGMDVARGQIIVTTDSDLAYPPDAIPGLIGHLESGYDVASGIRVDRQVPRFRKLASKFLNWWISRSVGSTLEDYGSMFRAYTRESVDLLRRFSESGPMITALGGWLGLRTIEVPVRCTETSLRPSTYRFGKLVRMAIHVITGVSAGPIRMVSLFGFVIAIVGFMASLYLVLYRIFEGPGPSGTVALIAALFFLAGVQLVALGVLGEYLARVYTDVRRRPLYVIRSITTSDAKVSEQPGDHARPLT